MKTKFDDYKSINVGLSYNKINGGAAADSIKKIISEYNLNVHDLDYREIVPLSDNLDDIFQNKAKFIKILHDAKTQAMNLLKDLDGLIIPGTDARIDPRLYNEPLSDHPDRIDLARSIAELAQVHVAIQRGMPILGICGGHQIINVYLGGTLQALSDENIDMQGFMGYAEVGFNSKTELAKIFFEDSDNRRTFQQLDVYSHRFFGAHKHAIKELSKKKLANGQLMISKAAIADDSDYTVECFESNYGAPLYSMQFHPEVGVKGMYSRIYKAISYQAETSIDIKINSKIFTVFQQAMETFHLKKSLCERIENKKAPVETTKECESALIENKKDGEQTSPVLDLYSMFRDIETNSASLLSI
jgi:gamma-glutamyl-gamma-aminobutyrate hydrolase PuuD